MNRQNAMAQLPQSPMLSTHSAATAILITISIQLLGLPGFGHAQVNSQAANPENSVAGRVPDGASDSADTDSVNTATMQRLLQQLQSPRFAQRRKASNQLREMGIGAHEKLRQIAESGDSESATRAMDLLKKASLDSDLVLAASARESLRKIAASDNPRAKTADRALRPAIPMPSFPLLGGGQPGLAPLAPRPAQPPAFAPRRRTNLRISIRTTNGTQEIDVIENDKEFKFRDAGGGIETQSPDGKGGAKKATYKDAEEMLKKDPDAFRAYQRAGGSKAGVLGGAFRTAPQGIFGNGFRPAPNAQPIPKPNPIKPLGPRIELHPEISPPALPKPRPTTQPERTDV
jgi:hypothetical protein